jgi:hypothetical protein
MTMVKLLEKKTLTSDVTDKIVASRHVVTRSIQQPQSPKQNKNSDKNNNSL